LIWFGLICDEFKQENIQRSPGVLSPGEETTEVLRGTEAASSFLGTSASVRRFVEKYWLNLELELDHGLLSYSSAFDDLKPQLGA